MNLNWRNLKNNTDEILKAEIGSLLFNLGKTHIGFSFWKDFFTDYESEFKFGSYKEYYKKEFEKELNEIDPKLKEFIFNKTTVKINEEEKWVEYFKGPESNSEMVKKVFFKGCENINSGIDKGSPKNENQLKGKLWVSNAFGSFKEEVRIDKFDNKRREFFKNLHHFLEENNYYENPDWKHTRDFIIKELKNWYIHLLSDSRMPVNDVTLYDQAYMSATMFKAALAGMMLETSESKNYLENPQSIKWQILGIQYDKLSLAEKGVKPAHIFWYREVSKNVDDEIKKLIETDYVLGNEIYRDESGIYFLVPEDIENDFENVKLEIQRRFKNKFDDEIYPYITFSKASRGIMNLTKLLEKAKENFLKADYSLRSDLFYYGSETGICQVCKSRLGKKEKDDRYLVCDICRERRKGRIDKWLKNQEGETIWIDEIADKNNRVALITLKFELIEWLNGDLLSSLISQIFDFSTFDNCNNISDILNDIKQGIKSNKKLNETCLRDYHTNIPNISLKQLLEKWLLERSIGDKWEEFIYKTLNERNSLDEKPLKEKIDFENRKIFWDELNEKDLEFLSKIILQFLLRKNSSPARLRRVWKNTQEFFEEVKKEILDTYVAQRTKKEFLELIEDFPKEKRDKLKEKTQFKQYFSIIDPTPISWQFIIPTNKVVNLLKQVQKFYYRNFKYVNGKLPLHIGIVVQKSKDPLYVGIKALRNIRRDINNWSEIKIDNFKFFEKYIENIDNKVTFCNIYEKKNNADSFYSLYETDNPEYDFMLLPSGKGVKKYNSTDSFVIYPNTIDFEFLDTNSRRNDIYYKNGKRVAQHKKNRPYSWEEFEKFEEFKKVFSDKTALLHRLVSLIYSKFEDWESNEESFKKFMNSTFKRIKKQDGIDVSNIFDIDNFDFNEAKKFIDMFEFWHTTLKEI